MTALEEMICCFVALISWRLSLASSSFCSTQFLRSSTGGMQCALGSSTITANSVERYTLKLVHDLVRRLPYLFQLAIRLLLGLTQLGDLGTHFAEKDEAKCLREGHKLGIQTGGFQDLLNSYLILDENINQSKKIPTLYIPDISLLV